MGILKVIDERGRVLPVDDSSLDYEHEYVASFSNAVLISDGVYLQDIWIATCQKDHRKNVFDRRDEIEFVKDRVYDHEPTKDELIQFMCANGCGLCDLVSVEKGYRLMVDNDE